MSIPELCIRRPVMTVLLTLALIAAGLFGLRLLPVAALPRVDFPVINVSGTLSGASPETMAASIATPLEKEFSTISGITSITSTNSLGSTSITLQFDLDRDIDKAAADVQAAITRAQRALPDDMTTPPSYRKVNPADQPVLLLSLSSRTLPLSKLDEYAQVLISPRLSTLTGVAQVQIYGSQKYAVRIQLDPDALAARGIGLDQVQNAVSAANVNTPVGTLSGAQQQLTLQVDTQLMNADAFRNLIIAQRDLAPVRLGDVAKVIDGVENDRSAGWFGDVRSIVMAVQRQPDANTVQVVDAVKGLLPDFRASLPASVNINVLNDRSNSIRAAVADVQFTLALTVALVILVIFLFVRRVAATVIPALTVPLALVGTAGVMYLLGFSIDNISLLALTLSVGLVVDDAIVVLENIFRYIEEGMKPFEAAIRGSREIAFTIVSITTSLIAVFIPIFFMGGVVGRVFHEFAVVTTVAIAISAIVSLTLTPMLCARFIKAHGPYHQEGRLMQLSERVFQGWLNLYATSLRWCLRRRPLMLAVFVATLVGTVMLGRAIPKGFFPIEDIGQISVSTEARQDISFPAMAALQQRAAAIIAADPYVAALTHSVGGSGGGGNALNAGRMFVTLVDRDKRPPIGDVIQQLRRKLNAVAGIGVFMQPVQNLQIGGRSSKSLYQYTLQGLDQKELYAWTSRVQAALSKLPEIQDVATDVQLNNQQASIRIDGDKARALGISADQLRSTLYSAYGTRQISTIYTSVDDYAVILELGTSFQSDADKLDRLYVSSDKGGLIPLSSFTEIERTSGPLTVNHQSQLPAATLSFNLAPGFALGDAVTAIENAERSLALPATISTSFQGTAQIFQEAQANQGLLLLAAVLAIYIVLGVLYESYIHPLTILSGLPSATLGALGTLYLFGQDLSVIAMIGMLMLIGIVKKNAIMMVDFAIDVQREQGLTPAMAIERACLMRFRPIMMTTMAAIMGTLPIAIGHGASAELRQPLGLAVVGGLIVSQMLTLYITPVIYIYMSRFEIWLHRQPKAPAVADGLAAPAE